MDRRAVFFTGAALVCFLLVPVAASHFRGVTIGVGVVYVLFAVASALDHRSRLKHGADSDSVRAGTYRRHDDD